MVRAGFGIPEMYAACQLSAGKKKTGKYCREFHEESPRTHSERLSANEEIAVHATL